ncbi:MAG: hypothetical protein ABJB66_18600, partial [Gemmatimonadaceae bacterium]
RNKSQQLKDLPKMNIMKLNFAKYLRSAAVATVLCSLPVACVDAPTAPSQVHLDESTDSARIIASALPVSALTAARKTAEGFAMIGGLYVRDTDLAKIGTATRGARRDGRCVVEIGTTFLEGTPATLSESEIQTVGKLLGNRSAVLLDAIFGTTAASLTNAPTQCWLVIMGNYHLSSSGTQAATAVGRMIRENVFPMLTTKSYRARVSIFVSPSLEDKAASSWNRLALATADGLAGIDDSWASRVRFVHNPSPEIVGSSALSTFSGEPTSVTIKAMTTATASTKSVAKNVSVGIIRMCNGTASSCKTGAKGQKQFFFTNDGYNVYVAGKEAKSTLPSSVTFKKVAPQSTTEFQAAASSLEASDIILLAWHGWMNKFDINNENVLPTYERPDDTLPHRQGFALNSVVQEWVNNILK